MTIPLIHVSEPEGQGLRQFLDLGWAFFLSAAIGLEREIRHKSAGLRTSSYNARKDAKMQPFKFIKFRTFHSPPVPPSQFR